MTDPPTICHGCGERQPEGAELRDYECCGIELCRRCQPYHSDICPVAFVEGWGEE